jgi:hypothetical protein
MLSTARRLLVATGLVVPVLLLGCESDEEAPTGDKTSVTAVASETAAVTAIPSTATPTPTLSPVPVLPGYTKYRWGDVTVVVPEDFISVGRWVATKEENPPDGGLVINLVQGDIVSASVLLDASDGHVVRESENLPAELRDAISTVRVDEPMEEPAPWPVGETPPRADKEVSGQIRYSRPEPTSGINLFLQCGEAAQPEESGCVLVITNGVSTAAVDVTNGETKNNRTSPSDAAVFDRWIASVERISP